MTTKRAHISWSVALVFAGLTLATVPTAAPGQTMTVNAVSGQSGQTVWFDVSFDPQFISVAATLNSISFDPTNTPIVSCTRDSALTKPLTSTMLPSGCGANGAPPCNRVRVMIMDGFDTDPHAILVPTVLYHCQVDISPSAAPGVYPLTIVDASASDPAGNQRQLSLVNGAIVVPAPGGGGCQTTGRGSPVSLWVLVLPLLLCGVRRFARWRQIRSRAAVVRAFVSLGLVCSLAVAGQSASGQTCAGDCGDDGAVTIDELVKAVRIALGSAPLSVCVVADNNGDGNVTVNEVILAVNHALDGCPQPPTPTAVDTSTPGPTSTLTLRPTRTWTPAPTPTWTWTPTPLPTLTFTATPFLTSTPRPTRTHTPVPTLTRTWTPTPVVTHTFTATPAFTSTPTLPPTPTPTLNPALARLVIQADNPSDTPRQACLSGTVVVGGALGAAMEYGRGPSAPPGGGPGPVCQTVPAGCAGCTAGRFEIRNLAPGQWLHRIDVSATGQLQYRRSLVVADPSAPNSVHWEVFKTVRIVTSGADSGAGSLRSAGSAANGGAAASRPWLILLNRASAASVNLTGGTDLSIAAAGTVIDGTGEQGNPSPLDDFASRIYPTSIFQLAPTAGGTLSASCAGGGGCNLAGRSAIRAAAPNVQIVGLSIKRTLGASNVLCCGDADVVAFDGNSAGSSVSTCRLDGGAADRLDANGVSGKTTPAQGKDCVDAQGTGGTAGNPVVIEDSELRFCHDRGIKSQTGYLRVERSWIHNNLRGGLFAQKPNPGTLEGVIDAVDNLIEQNGINCPNASADISQCTGQSVTRTTNGGASEASTQGGASRLITRGNIVRNGTAHGLFFQNNSSGDVRDDFVCGMNNVINPFGGSNLRGRGIEVQQFGGSVNDIVVRGSAFVLNQDAGVQLKNNSVGADFGAFGVSGLNAFARNGSGNSRNFRFVTSASAVAAMGNQWEHCYPLQNPNQDQCDESRISTFDTTNTNNTPGQFDRVDVGGSRVHAGSNVSGVQLTTVDTIFPGKAVRGGLISITGTGFNAISGFTSPPSASGPPVGTDCTDGVNMANRCNPLRGTCVEFSTDNGATWIAADEVLAVTPTHIVVKSPITCQGPAQIRVRRQPLTGPEVKVQPAQDTFNFCING